MRVLATFLVLLVGFGSFQEGDSIILPTPRVSLGSPSSGQLLEMPYDICAAGPDTILVADKRARQIVVFDRAGHFLTRIGRSGQGPGEFADLNAVTYSKGQILAADDDLGRISAFDAQGTFLRSWRLSDGPMSMVVWRDQVLVSVIRGKALIWSIGLHGETEAEPLVLRNQLPPSMQSGGYLSFLAIDGDGLLVVLKQAPSILRWDLLHSEAPPRVITPFGQTVEVQRKYHKQLLDSLPPQAIGHVSMSIFQSVVPLSRGRLLVEMIIPDSSSPFMGRTAAAIVIDSQTGMQQSPVVFPHTPPHWILRLLDRNTIAWVNEDAATVDIYSIPLGIL